VPRLFHIYRASNDVGSFEEMLRNIFKPLFEVTLDPSSNIELDCFLDTIVGFDSVDDESRPESGHLSAGANSFDAPDMWTHADNPPYGYWMYYMYSNIAVLNQLRTARGLSSFQFRPHCGEAGDPNHLISAYLVAHQVTRLAIIKDYIKTTSTTIIFFYFSNDRFFDRFLNKTFFRLIMELS
jgi:AMP deaminase